MLINWYVNISWTCHEKTEVREPSNYWKMLGKMEEEEGEKKNISVDWSTVQKKKKKDLNPLKTRRTAQYEEA